MLVVVAGGAGFLGGSLVDRLQAEGDEVVVVDDLSHGHLANLTEARRRGGVRFHRMDVSQGGLATLAGRVRASAVGSSQARTGSMAVARWTQASARTRSARVARPPWPTSMRWKRTPPRRLASARLARWPWERSSTTTSSSPSA